MENSDGFLRNSKKIQKTRIIPLRWIGNICGGFAGNHIVKAAYMDENVDFTWRYAYHAKMYKVFNKPYEWWGTYWMVDINEKY